MTPDAKKAVTTLEEIAKTLPNGFHDAQIKSIRIDYVKREVTIDFEIWVADSSEDDSDMYRDAELKLSRFFYLVIEPPDSNYDYYDEKPLWVDAPSGEGAVFTRYELPAAPKGGFTFSFFVHDWNAFINLAAMDATISWK